MRQGLVTIGLTTLDVVARPIDALPDSESTSLVEGIALAPAGTPIYVVHDPLAARDDAVYLFEPLARGGGWVGPGAANDLGWMEELFTHLKWAWERYEEAQRGQKFIAPEVEGLALTLAGLLGHFE